MDSFCAEAGEGRGAKTSYTIEARVNMVLQDVGFIFLLVQENYLNYKPCRGASILNAFSKASDYLCDGDVMDKSICRGRRELSELFSMILVLTCSSILQGTRQSFDTTADHKLRFPMWLSKSSKKRNLSFKRCDLDTPSFLKGQLKISADDNPKNVQHFSFKAPDPTRASEDLFAILRHR
ncbi:replication factor C subunit 1-like [Selaginella moellendorffii]|uniref:replication factor C subunit 1-like n=1 Tax=Selaginella moellendorffii TaxID=88036 RepID=UPI000D1C8141|nr:replication factor C subunit 1-like [Selaginella moellendorffii]|eukprot:XP_024532660.1 replication factor C subunit 1-like [Selaginella moellendorffii]